jgi:hypothetical protein
MGLYCSVKAKVSGPDVLKQLIASGKYDSSKSELDKSRFKRNWHLSFFRVVCCHCRFNVQQVKAYGGAPLLAMVMRAISLCSMSKGFLQSGAAHVGRSSCSALEE